MDHTPPQEVAANVGAIVADEVRRLLESAERGAEDLHRQAVDDVGSDHEAVRHTAELVQERIDAIEAGVTRLLRQLRAEVRQIADDAATGSRSPPPADPGDGGSPPADEPAAEVASAHEPAAEVASADQPGAEIDPEDQPAADAGPEDQPAADAGPEDQPAADAGPDDQPAADAGPDDQPAADAGPDDQPAAEAGPEDRPAAESRPAAAVTDDVPDRPTADVAAATDDTAAAAIPATKAPPLASDRVPMGRRRRGLFRRFQRTGPAPRCAVCGRTPEADADRRAIKRWKATGDVTLCPDCQAEGWR